MQCPGAGLAYIAGKLQEDVLRARMPLPDPAGAITLPHMRHFCRSALLLCLLALVACGSTGTTTTEVWFLTETGTLASEDLEIDSGSDAQELAAALAALAAGPRDAGLVPVLPPDTALSSDVSDGTATVDIGAGFSSRVSAAGSSAAIQVVAPIVWTATAVEGVDDVLLTEGGAPLELTGSGLVFDDPLTRDDFPGVAG